MPKAKIIRKKAKATLDKKLFKSGWLWPLLIFIIEGAIISLLGIISPAVTAILGVASATYYIALSRRTAEAKNLGIYFSTMKDDIVGKIILGLLYYFYLFLWGMVPVVGIVKRYSYSMTFYIKTEHPNYTAKEAITKSREMMNGYKWKLFCLDLSFFGWYILSFLTFGVLAFWLAPYKTAAYTHFYEELKEARANEIIIK